MEPDYREILARLVEQIDMCFAAGEDVSQEVWDIKVETKKLLQQK